jgi:hypothetical protein
MDSNDGDGIPLGNVSYQQPTSPLPVDDISLPIKENLTYHFMNVAAQSGNSAAQIYCGNHLSIGAGKNWSEILPDLAYLILSHPANEGDVNILTENSPEAIEQFRLAAQGHSYKGHIILGYCKLNGIGCETDLEGAEQEFQHAISQIGADIDCIFNCCCLQGGLPLYLLGETYLRGVGFRMRFNNFGLPRGSVMLRRQNFLLFASGWELVLMLVLVLRFLG